MSSSAAPPPEGFPLRRRLLLLVSALGVIVLLTGSALGLTLKSLREAQDRSERDLRPAVSSAEELLSQFINEETGERGYVITGRPSFLAPYVAASARVPDLVTSLSSHAKALPGLAGRVDAVMAAHRRWQEQSAQPEIETVRRGDLQGARALVAAGAGRRHFDELRRSMATLEAGLGAAQAASTAQVQMLATRLTTLLVLTLAVLAALVLLLYPALQRLVVGPLERFARSARRAGRDLTVPVVADGPREIVVAANEVEGMRQRLVEQIGAARQAIEGLAQRGPAVGALREALTPAARHPPGLDLAGQLQPAEGVLAGDWFDVVPLGPDRVALVVGDVAGHGPGPAVFALRLQGSLASALAAGADPAQALAAVTTLLGETGELFATVFIAVVDLPGQRLAYANAGHPPAVLTVAERGHPTRTVALPLTGPIVSGPPLAGGWQTVSHPFRAGDLLLIYTDGLTEARDGAGQEFGLGRIRSVVAGHRGDMDGLVSRLGDDVGSHARARLTDDVTVLACRRTLTDAPLVVGGQRLKSPRPVP